MKSTALFLFFSLLLSASCEKVLKPVRIHLVNESDNIVEFVSPSYSRFVGINNKDSTLRYWISITEPTCLCLPHSEVSYYSGFDNLEDMAECDTLRIFVFDPCLPWNDPYMRIRKDAIDNDIYLVRYDLTIENLNNLSTVDKTGVSLIISYPPDSRMKDVKMYPPLKMRDTHCE